MGLTQSRLKELLTYDPITGVFTWNSTGERAGYVNAEGYRKINIDGKDMSEHRLAWLDFYGVLPLETDHENGIQDDNRIVNLRDVSHAENMKNKALYASNKSGYPGVMWEKSKSLWVARIPVNGKLKTLGRSKDKAVVIALKQAAERALGYHPNHGRAA